MNHQPKQQYAQRPAWGYGAALGLAVALLFPAHALADETGPGYRELDRPGILAFRRSQERHIERALDELRNVEQAREEALQNLEEEHEQAVAALEDQRDAAADTTLMSGLWNWARGQSPADIDRAIEEEEQAHQVQRAELIEEYDERYQRALRRLENRLATPTDDAINERYEATTPGTMGREEIETYAAAENLRSVANEQLGRLRARRTDYEQAEKAYDTLLELIACVISMNQQFVHRLDQVYRPEIQRIAGQIESHKSRLAQDEGIAESLRESELDRMNRLDGHVQALEQRIPTMRDQAEARMATLERRLKDTEHLRRGVAIAGDLGEIVGDLQESFAEMEFELPELVEYDIDDLDFELEI